jgi:hypothetical protein
VGVQHCHRCGAAVQGQRAQQIARELLALPPGTRLSLLAPLLDAPSFAGFFVWRLYADPDDTSQEAEWGFSPRGKLAELVVRDAFAARWVADPTARPPAYAAVTPGIYGNR